MEKFKNAFKILYLISAGDDEVSSSELDLIMTYLKENRDSIDFDHRQITGSLLFLSKEEKRQILEKAALDYKDNTSRQERENLLKFAFQLVISDGRIATEEIRMFNILGNVWNIDIDEFIKANHIQ
jgi:tellurite resistance protein